LIWLPRAIIGGRLPGSSIHENFLDLAADQQQHPDNIL
jgi:hypothetical protein